MKSDLKNKWIKMHPKQELDSEEVKKLYILFEMHAQYRFTKWILGFLKLKF